MQQHTVNSSAMAHPICWFVFRMYRYSIIVGATPKEIASDSESNCSPNLLSALSNLAIRPSSPSRIAAIMISATAYCHCSLIANRIALSPLHSATNVIRFVMMRLKGIPAAFGILRVFLFFCLSCIVIFDKSFFVCCDCFIFLVGLFFYFGDYSFSCDHGLPFGA